MKDNLHKKVKKKMKLFLNLTLGAVCAFKTRSNVSVDGLGRTYVEKENVFMPKDDTPSCFYTPGQVLATGSMEACVGGPGLCPATMPNFAGSDISNKVPNNGKPTEFCDNFYRDWFGAVTELRLYCINDKAVTGHGELRGIQGRYGPPPGGNRQGS